MQILSHLKCNVCGAHAPVQTDVESGKLKCMTCGTLGYNDGKNFTTRAEVAIEPKARNTMTQEQFEAFVAERWEQHVAVGEGPDAISNWPFMDADSRGCVLRFALALINDAPN